MIPVTHSLHCLSVLLDDDGSPLMMRRKTVGRVVTVPEFHCFSPFDRLTWPTECKDSLINQLTYALLGLPKGGPPYVTVSSPGVIIPGLIH